MDELEIVADVVLFALDELFNSDDVLRPAGLESGWILVAVSLPTREASLSL